MRKRRLSLWISPRDIAQLVSIGIDHPGIRFEIVYGVSGQPALVVRQLERGAARLPAAGRFRGVRGRSPAQGKAGQRRDRRGRTRAGNSCARSSCPFPASLAWQQQRPEFGPKSQLSSMRLIARWQQLLVLQNRRRSEKAGVSTHSLTFFRPRVSLVRALSFKRTPGPLWSSAGMILHTRLFEVPRRHQAGFSSDCLVADSSLRLVRESARAKSLRPCWHVHVCGARNDALGMSHKTKSVIPPVGCREACPDGVA